jgi:hypothetical protein
MKFNHETTTAPVITPTITPTKDPSKINIPKPNVAPKPQA